MTDHGRGVADGSFVRPDFCRHFVPFSSREEEFTAAIKGRYLKKYYPSIEIDC
jgi:hypothetical protein